MIVVADSSPLIVLMNIGHIDVLPKLFEQIVIPPEVAVELRQSNRPNAVRDFAASFPPWLVERTPAAIEAIPELHADLLLIDEIRGRRAAVQRQLRITGTIGVLESAADASLLDLAEAFARVKQTNFWISHELLDERLKLHPSHERRP